MFDMPEAYSMTLRKARKNHKCCECRGVIEAGEKYHYHSGIWEGIPQSFKVCIDCEALRGKVAKDGCLSYDEWPAFTCLGDDLEFDHADAFRAIKEKRRGLAKDQEGK